MARILLTGASGFIGRNLVEFDEGGHHWMLVDNQPCNAPQHGRSKFENVQVDLRDGSAVKDLVEHRRPDVVIHLAGWTGKGRSHENRRQLLEANVATTWNILDALTEIGAHGGALAQFVLPSTALVYGSQPGPFRESMVPRPVEDYGLSKLMAEEVVRSYGARGVVTPVILRAAVLYGPGQQGSMFVPSLVKALATGTRYPMTAGLQKRDFLHVRDAVRGIFAVLRSGRDGEFQLGTGVGVSMREVAEILADAAGRRDLLGIGEIPYRDNESMEYVVDPRLLRELTTWRAEIPLEQGLRETLARELAS